MARFRQVSRTVEYTEALVMCVNVSTQTVTHEAVTLSGTYDTPEKLLKAANEVLSKELKPVSVEEANVLEKTFCMPESYFIEHSMPLPVGKKQFCKADFEEFYNTSIEGDEDPTTED